MQVCGRAVFLGCVAAAIALGQEGAPRFEVASITACKEAAPAGTGQKGARGGGSASSPGRLDLPCLPVRFFIQLAYVLPDSRLHGGGTTMRLEGGPGWIDSERYRIVAKPEGPASQEMMDGPMLQSLLEDRFHLKIHRETREVAVYALTVAKNGLKIPRADGSSCAPRGGLSSLPPPARGQKPWCGQLRGQRNAQRVTIDLPGATMAQFAQALGWLERPVTDRTGVSGTFDFHVEFAPEGAGAADDVEAPSVFTALGQLGLKLEEAKGPREFVVIDHIERPSEN